MLRNDVERGRIPGAVVVVVRSGKVASVQAVGFRDKAANAAMTPDAIFRLASMTKPLVTVAALSLYEEGRLLLSDPVSKYIPALKTQTVGLERAPVEREMTVLISDIRGFTTLIEDMDVLEASNLAMGFLRAVELPIISCNGMIQDVRGDEIVAAIDLKTDRTKRKLLIQKWTWMTRGRNSLKPRIEEELHRFEQFQLATSEMLAGGTTTSS